MSFSRETGWPAWWEWELDLSPHLLKRMVDRGFSEIELRSMMELARELREGEEPGRWVVETSHESGPWQVIVQPDPADRLLVVITAFPVEPT